MKLLSRSLSPFNGKERNRRKKHGLIAVINVRKTRTTNTSNNRE